MSKKPDPQFEAALSLLGKADKSLNVERHARVVMIDYLALCSRKQDWHGVMDAAADLREIDARIQAYEQMLGVA